MEGMTLTCPKCGAAMRTYERNGVVVDQCTECRGLFLDRGELERLTEAEGRYYEDPPRDRGGRDDDDDDYAHRGARKSRKRSFLENLFEGD
jgi:hypothetical protein